MQTQGARRAAFMAVAHTAGRLDAAARVYVPATADPSTVRPRRDVGARVTVFAGTEEARAARR